MDTLSDRDLALLHTRFVVPVMVGQMLRGVEALDEAAEYALNSVLSELQPDTALLCVALCAQHLGTSCGHMPSARMLKIEADRVVEEYGALWLANENHPQTLDEATIARTLGYIPEDLEAMAHLLDATLAELPGHNNATARLCDLLALQAHEHMELAETQLQALHLNSSRRKAMPVSAAARGNVVAFPAGRRG